MRIIIGIIVGTTLWAYTAVAQTPVTKSGELWVVWEEAEKKLEAGEFNNAIILYQAYQPNFNSRLKQVQSLKQLYLEGQKLQKAGKYTEAINTYKKHRNFEGIGSLTAFDKQIDECVRRMTTGNGSGIKDLDKRILASELAYKGQKKLRELDTLGAFRDYSQAKKYGGNSSATLKEQYEEGLKITKELGEWGQRYSKLKSGGLSPDQEKDLLENYRKIKGVPVLNTVEIKVREIVAKIEGRNSMLSYAQNCETDLLVNYISQNKSQFNFSASLVSTLSQYRSIQNKIGMLKSNVENARTVKSAFFSIDSMVRSVKELPDNVKRSLETCIKNDKSRTFEGYAYQARRAGNMGIANKYEDIAQGKEIDLDGNTSPCSGSDAFNKNIISIQEKLEACKPEEARKIWNEVSAQLADCPEKDSILKSYRSLAGAITRMELSERAFNNYRTDVKRLLQDGKYNPAKEKYAEMSKLEVCDTDERDQEIAQGLAEIKLRQIKPLYRVGFTAGIGANKPMYKIDNQKQDMSYGLITSGGIDVSFIDHHNPIDLVFGVEYINTQYFALNNEGFATESYKLGGVGISLNIKIHPSNTNPNKVRPYFKIGREGLIPVTYQYKNYSTLVKIEDKQPLRNVISSIQGGLGLEIQKKDFGFFVEGGLNYGIDGIYDNRESTLAVNGNKPTDAKFRRFGIKLGLRFW